LFPIPMALRSRDQVTGAGAHPVHLLLCPRPCSIAVGGHCSRPWYQSARGLISGSLCWTRLGDLPPASWWLFFVRAWPAVSPLPFTSLWPASSRSRSAGPSRPPDPHRSPLHEQVRAAGLTAPFSVGNLVFHSPVVCRALTRLLRPARAPVPPFCDCFRSGPHPDVVPCGGCALFSSGLGAYLRSLFYQMP